jgi:hypothetical protein
MKCAFKLAVLAVSLLASHAFAVGSLMEVRVYDRIENRELPVYAHNGKYYVVGKPKNEYQIVLRNQSATDLLGVVSVDGVNAVSGETASPDQTGYVLYPGQSYEIKGWRKSLERTAAFYFTQHGDSYAARTGRPDNVGVIGVAVFRPKYRPPQPVPYQGMMEDQRERDAAKDEAGNGAMGHAQSRFEPQAQAKAPQAAEKSIGTGHGRSETSYVQYADFERASTTPDEVITIYYDTYRNLVAKGVIVEPVCTEPQPFPAQFVPDLPVRRFF